MDTKNISIYIEKEKLDKIRCIANRKGRSVNSQIVAMIREAISYYEKHPEEVER